MDIQVFESSSHSVDETVCQTSVHVHFWSVLFFKFLFIYPYFIFICHPLLNCALLPIFPPMSRSPRVILHPVFFRWVLVAFVALSCFVASKRAKFTISCKLHLSPLFFLWFLFNYQTSCSITMSDNQEKVEHKCHDCIPASRFKTREELLAHKGQHLLILLQVQNATKNP